MNFGWKENELEKVLVPLSVGLDLFGQMKKKKKKKRRHGLGSRTFYLLTMTTTTT